MQGRDDEILIEGDEVKQSQQLQPVVGQGQQKAQYHRGDVESRSEIKPILAKKKVVTEEEGNEFENEDEENDGYKKKQLTRATFKQYMHDTYVSFATSWVGEDISPTTILYIFIVLLSYNLILFFCYVSSTATILLVVFAAAGTIAFFFWSTAKWKFLGAWLVIVPIILAISISLSSVYFSFYLTLKGSAATDITVENAPDYQTDIYGFTDGIVKGDYMGEFFDSDSKYYCVAPVVSTSKSPVNDITVWAGCAVSDPCNSSDAQSQSCIKKWSTNVREGFRIFDAQTEFQNAITNCLQKFSIRQISGAPLIYWNDPTIFISKYRETGGLLVGIPNAAWIILTAISLSYLVKKYLVQGYKFIAV